MGLLNLREKITIATADSAFSEKEILYLIVEVRKYIERGNKSLGDANELKLDSNNYHTIKFFRDWAVHPQKHFSDVPLNIKSLLEAITKNDNGDIEKGLTTLLVMEMIEFYKAIGVDSDIINNFKWDYFLNSLKGILVEQPIKLTATKWVGYDTLLRLGIMQE